MITDKKKKKKNSGTNKKMAAFWNPTFFFLTPFTSNPPVNASVLGTQKKKN